MQTGNYITVDAVLLNAAGFAGDTKFVYVPWGFYVQQIDDAFQELNMDTKMLDGHADFAMADYTERLNIPLPEDCFNVTGVYMYDGDICNISLSRKVWWKRNFFTQGNGYIANRTGVNTNDPYYLNNSLIGSDLSNHHQRLDLIRYENNATVNNILFYNIENGVLMLSPSCRNAGSKIHIAYNSTGCPVGEAPIIPRFYKKAIEDYVTEAALRFRMANEPSMAKTLQALQISHERRLDRYGFNGSWQDALTKSRSLSSAQRNDLFVYLQKAAWATGR